MPAQESAAQMRTAYAFQHTPGDLRTTGVSRRRVTPRLSSEASHRVLMTFWGRYSGYDP
ncbi:MAG: hypothetical protein GY801_32790 [bacterium]|nr:hypothetical protein [bacterium]